MGRVCGKHDSEEKGVPDVIKLYYTHFGRSLFVRFWNLSMEKWNYTKWNMWEVSN